MAMSEEEIPDTAQHYLVCDTENCKRNCQFYCNPCHRQLCEQCKDEHQKCPDTKNHEVVPYKQRRPKLPEVKCKLHPTRNVEILCKECNIPLCPKCIFLEEHTGHKFDDLEEGYAEKVKLCRNEITKIKEYFLLTSADLKTEIMGDITRIEETMDDIRKSIKAEAESLKELVDKVTSDKLEQVKTMEDSLKKSLESQETIFDNYIAYLDTLVKEFHSYMSSSNIRDLFSEDFENLKTQSIPETTQPVLPVYSVGQFCRDDVFKLLGSINVPSHEPEKRKIKPMATSFVQLKPGGEIMKLTLSLSSSVTKVREYKVSGVDKVFHLSLGKSDRLWVSDDKGNLVQTDLQGNQLQKIQASGRCGNHTVTQDGDLIYTDKHNKVIYRITPDDTITEFIKTGDWKPISIYCSHINGDILMGIMKGREAKVTRYNKTGEEIQNIQRDNKGQGLYSHPHYITENINGDICTSDYDKRALVVVNKSGQYRFSYTGQGSKFLPYAVCTDLIGHILVCDVIHDKNAVHLLDENGRFLRELLTKQHVKSTSVSVDNENNLHVGQYTTNIVTVYKYLQ